MADGGSWLITRRLGADIFLPCFGLNTNVGPPAEWDLWRDQVWTVFVPATCSTTLVGIFAIGNVGAYPRKLGLTVTGFAEAAFAARAADAYVFSGSELHFMHSTTRGDPALQHA